MKHKKSIALILCSALTVTGVLVALHQNDKNVNTINRIVLSADYPKYDSLDHIVDRADTIIKGKILNSRYQEINITQTVDPEDELLNPGGEPDQSTIPYTIYQVQIEESLKGTYAQNDIIEVKTLGGLFDNTEYVLSDNTGSQLEQNMNYVLFLETYPDSPASLLNPGQASYEYDENDNIVTNEPSTFSYITGNQNDSIENDIYGDFETNTPDKFDFTMQELTDLIHSKY